MRRAGLTPARSGIRTERVQFKKGASSAVVEAGITGGYKIRVYLMRSAARRNETAKYRLEMIISGAGDAQSHRK